MNEFAARNNHRPTTPSTKARPIGPLSLLIPEGRPNETQKNDSGFPVHRTCHCLEARAMASPGVSKSKSQSFSIYDSWNNLCHRLWWQLNLVCDAAIAIMTTDFAERQIEST
jgi:hypothetical protein